MAAGLTAAGKTILSAGIYDRAAKIRAVGTRFDGGATTDFSAYANDPLASNHLANGTSVFLQTALGAVVCNIIPGTGNTVTITQIYVTDIAATPNVLAVFDLETSVVFSDTGNFSVSLLNLLWS